MANLWFCPNIGAPDTLELFRQPEAWAEARSKISTFQFYAQHIMAGVEVDMATHPNWGLVGPNTFPAFLAVDAFRKLAEWGIKVSIEIGSVKPGDCNAMSNADLTINLIKRIQAAGGNVDFIAMDEPVASSKSAFWSGMTPGLGCNLSLAEAAMASVNYCKAVQQECPGVTIGLIEAYPNTRASDFMRFVQFMSEGGFHPQFLHLDVDRNALKNKINDQQLMADMDALGRMCQRAPIPYGQILWGQMFKTPAQYRESVLSWAAKVKRFAVQPNTLIVQSWEALNGIKELPKNLPQSDPNSHTNLINTIAQSFGIPPRDNQPPVVVPPPAPSPSPVPSGANMIPVTFKTYDGHYLCAEGGGGRELVANRSVPDVWETFQLEPADGGRWSLRANNGQYVVAELDGRVFANRNAVGPWESWAVETRDTRIALRSYHNRYLVAEGGGLSTVSANREHIGEWELFTPSNRWFEAQSTRRPLIGPLRIHNKIFYDNTGPRRVLFASWFPALRILRDNPQEFERTLNAITNAGYQGIRVFLCVGGWSDFWDGREVAPITFQKWYWTGNFHRTDRLGGHVLGWPDYDDLLRTLLRACKARKLRLHVTTGDMQIITGPDLGKELELHRRLSRICKEEGGTDVIALAETTNEFPINRFGGESPQSIGQMGEIIHIWASTIPGVLTAQGAIPQDEEPASLYLASTYGNVLTVHPVRSPVETCIKHTHALVHWEGNYRFFPKPYWEGEPAGPGPESFDRLDDPASLVAIYSMCAITGQATNQFSGPSVRNYAPLDSVWGFKELPNILAHIPEDVATWSHGNSGGGIEYWWKGNDFVTVAHSTWNTNPPRPVATWTLYDGGAPLSGYDTPPRMTGLFEGKFR